MTNEKDIATRVAEKEAEIERYKEILNRYLNGPERSSRWYNSGKVHLEELEHELDELLFEQSSK
jgi:hypothetical protein